MPPKGHYLNDSNYYVGILPDNTKKFYCQERDYLEEFDELLKEIKQSKEKVDP